jgi:uncharacterized repeat protein (TIGR03803 family)
VIHKRIIVSYTRAGGLMKTSLAGFTLAVCLFAADVHAVQFQTLWHFTGGDDGGSPESGLVLAGDGELYGTSSGGGTNNNGTVFRIQVDSLSAPASGYDTWAAGITNGLTAIYQSATGDGYPNLLKYFTGSSPTIPDDLARLNATQSNNVFNLLFNRNTGAVDVIAIAEGSYSASDNAAWVGIATNMNGSWGGATNVTEISTGTPRVVIVRDPAPAATNRFLRLRLSKP